MRHLQELRIADMAVRDTERALGTQADLQYRNDSTRAREWIAPGSA